MPKPRPARRRLRPAEDHVCPDAPPNDVRPTRPDLGAVLEGGTTVRRPGHLPSLISSRRIAAPSTAPSGRRSTSSCNSVLVMPTFSHARHPVLRAKRRDRYFTIAKAQPSGSRLLSGAVGDRDKRRVASPLEPLACEMRRRKTTVLLPAWPVNASTPRVTVRLRACLLWFLLVCATHFPFTLRRPRTVSGGDSPALEG